MADSFYNILLNFTPYVQLLAAIDFGLLVLESHSVTVKFQRNILSLQKDKCKPVLNEAGSLTKQCQERWYNKDDAGRSILGLAEIIRKRKEVFLMDTELEQQSAFMPALGLFSGLFCVLYLIIVPFLIDGHSLAVLYWLEYIAEAVLLGEAIVMLTFAFLPAYRGYFISMTICGIWIIIGIALALVLYLFHWNIPWGEFAFYVFLILVIPSVPMLFLIGRLIVMVIDRHKRIVSIREDIATLRSMIQKYHKR